MKKTAFQSKAGQATHEQTCFFAPFLTFDPMTLIHESGLKIMMMYQTELSRSRLSKVKSITKYKQSRRHMQLNAIFTRGN